MDAISLGPLMLATDRLYLMVAVVAFFLGAEGLRVLVKRRGGQAELGVALNLSFWSGLIGGRLFFVLQHWSSYQEQWWTVLYFWQPGYSPWAVVVCALLALAWSLRQQIKLCLVVSLWLLCCVALWGGLLLGQPLQSASSVKTLPDTQLPTLGGAPSVVNLAAMQEPLLINLWASWCGPCRREMPALIKFAEQNPQLKVLLVNSGESAIRVQQFVRDSEFDIPQSLVLLDPTQSVLQHFSAPGLPVTLAFSQGQLKATHIGELNLARLQQMAAQIQP